MRERKREKETKRETKKKKTEKNKVYDVEWERAAEAKVRGPIGP